MTPPAAPEPPRRGPMTDAEFAESLRRAERRAGFREGVVVCLVVAGLIAATALGLSLN